MLHLCSEHFLRVCKEIRKVLKILNHKSKTIKMNALILSQKILTKIIKVSKRIKVSNVQITLRYKLKRNVIFTHKEMFNKFS